MHEVAHCLCASCRKGIGEAKAISIIAAMELGRRRRSEETLELKKITSSKEVFNLKAYEFNPAFLTLPKIVEFSKNLSNAEATALRTYWEEWNKFFYTKKIDTKTYTVIFEDEDFIILQSVDL